MPRRGLVFIGALGVWLACSAADPLPEDLLGVWRHPDPAYADRTLELRPDRVTFGTGAGGSRTYPISHVEAERDGDLTTFTIEYRHEEGGLVPLRLVFTPGADPELRLGQRPGIWRPADARIPSQETSS